MEAILNDDDRRVLLNKLRSAHRLDFPCVVADSSSVRAVHGGKTDPNPTDRHNAGSKHYLFVDASSAPLNMILMGANRHDSTRLVLLLDGMPFIAAKRGRLLVKPRHVQAERGYDCEAYRRLL